MIFLSPVYQYLIDIGIFLSYFISCLGMREVCNFVEYMCVYYVTLIYIQDGYQNVCQ